MTRVSAGVDRSPILRDPGADASFRELGFANVRFCAREQLDQLRRAVVDLIPGDSGPFFSLYRNDWPELRREIDVVVRGLMQARADELLCNHRFYLGSLLVKFPGEGSFLAPHQDWSFVDETKHVSGIVWLPLQPTDQTNGGLSVIPRSHRLDLPFRGTPPDPLGQLDGLVPCAMEPGDAVVYHNALIHGSSENRSEDLRIAMVLGFVSADAPMVHYFTDERGRKWRFDIPDDFPFHYQPPDRPGREAVLGRTRWRDDRGRVGRVRRSAR